MAEHVQVANTIPSRTLSLGPRAAKAPPSVTTGDTGKTPHISRTPKQQGVAIGAAGPSESSAFSGPKPPDALVKTWVWLWKSGPTPEVCREGRARLVQVFGSIEVASAYIQTLK